MRPGDPALISYSIIYDDFSSLTDIGLEKKWST